MTLQIPAQLRVYAFALLGLIVVAALVLLAAALFTGHDLADPRITTPLGFALTIISILLAALGLSGQVAAVHTAINGRVEQLVDAAAVNGFQAGQAAGPGAPLPPAPSTVTPPPPAVK